MATKQAEQGQLTHSAISYLNYQLTRWRYPHINSFQFFCSWKTSNSYSFSYMQVVVKMHHPMLPLI